MPSLVLLFVLSLTLSASAPVGKRSSGASSRVAPAIGAAKTVSLAAAPGAMAPETASVLAKLEAATRGLQMPSETDAPMTVKFWPSEKTELSPNEVAALAEPQAEAPVEIQSVAEFFQSAALVEDWMSDDEKATAQRFRDLVATLQAELEQPQVYLFGQRERTVVVVGKVKGGFGGLVTLVVET